MKDTAQPAAPQLPSHDGPATLDSIQASLNALPLYIHETAKWAIQKESRMPSEGDPGGAIYQLLMHILERDGALYHSDGLYDRLSQSMYEELGKVGLHPPPKP